MLDDPQNVPIESGGLTPFPPLEPITPPAPREIWTLRDLFLFIAFIPFAYIASYLLILLGYAVIRPWAGWHENVYEAQKSTPFLLTLQSLFYVFISSYLFLMAEVLHNQPFWRSLGWKRPTGKQIAGWLAIGSGIAVAAGIALTIRPDTSSFPLEELFSSRAAAIALGVFAVAVAPIVEEIVFRGLLFAICERTMGMFFAVVITAGLFATLHIPEYWPAWNHILIIFVVGLAFSFARGFSGALTPSIFLHIGYNSLMILGFFASN
jgi:membrane protease YdiL (CAAX protease family)